MNLKSADKSLNFNLNTLPRTLAPWEAIKTFRQKTLKIISKLKEKKCQKTKFRTECCDFTKKILSTNFDKINDRKWRVNEKSENLQCGMSE